MPQLFLLLPLNDRVDDVDPLVSVFLADDEIVKIVDFSLVQLAGLYVLSRL